MQTNLAAYTYAEVEGGFSYHLTDESVSYDIYSNQVADTDAYVVTPQDTINAAKFSSFVASFYLVVNDSYDGVCIISSKDGTVCLLQNVAKDAMQTYRVNTTKWQTAITAGTGTTQLALL